MSKAEVQKEYFEWLCDMVKMPPEYRMLMDKLRRTDFVWIIDRDENRAKDGKEMRYFYVCEKAEEAAEREKLEEILAGPCSILEFMVALARRIETDVMASGESDDRTDEWFREMLSNLDLLKFDDKRYSENEVDYILNRFMSRKYGENGDGNIFKNPYFEDEKEGKKGGPLFCNLEIWLQVNRYLADKVGL